MDGSANGFIEDMHRHVSWMQPADVVILKFLHSARTPRGDPAIQTPKTVAMNTGYSSRTTSARCQVLAEHGLVEKHNRGEYQLTELGEGIVTNEISLDVLEEPAENEDGDGDDDADRDGADDDAASDGDPAA